MNEDNNILSNVFQFQNKRSKRVIDLITLKPVHFLHLRCNYTILFRIREKRSKQHFGSHAANPTAARLEMRCDLTLCIIKITMYLFPWKQQQHFCDCCSNLSRTNPLAKGSFFLSADVANNPFTSF